MNPRLRRRAPQAYTVYAWFFVLFGAAGILLSHLEPSLLHGLTVLPEQRDALAGVVHQLRFLRALELGFGLVMLASRERFFASEGTRNDVNRALLAALFAVPAARTLSLLLDGPPAPIWTGLLVAEWALVLWLRNGSEPTPGQPATPVPPA
ncbi:MAG: DUF4345 family protein [Deltaproteobacteria bacterium]|nr:DUF4345 family protein [Deltaproteobacteria bacterium]